MKLQGKVAIVTGAGRGLGKAIAEMYASEGAVVIVADRDYGNAKDVATFIEGIGGRAFALHLDVASRDSVENMVAHVTRLYGRIDILVNNAGITRDTTLRNMTYDMWDAVISVNLTGVFNCARAVVEQMIQQNSGCIINISSIVGVHGNKGQTNYGAAKAGVANMAKTWATELGKKNIRVNAIAPGFMRTDMTADMKPDALKAVEAQIPLGHLGEAEDIAEACLYLATAKYVSGTILEVNGGLHI